MLSQADLDLIQRDRDLPGLELLLDPLAFTARLRAAFPTLDLGMAEVNYIRYKSGTNCLAKFSLDVAGSPVSGYAKGYRWDDQDKLGKLHLRSTVRGPLGVGRLLLSDIGVEINIFPNDNKLPSIRKLYSASGGAQLLERVVADLVDFPTIGARSMRYKPERRYVAQLRTADGPHAVLKFYTDAGYRSALTAATAFSSLDRVRVPQRIGGSDRHHILAFDWAGGCSLQDILIGPTLRVDVIKHVGATLAAIHAHPTTRLPRRHRRSVADSVREIANSIEFLFPPAAELAHDIATHLTHELMQGKPHKRPTHGDFYARQVLLDDGGVIILDLDEAVMADPAADLGLFIAHLERDALRGDMPGYRVEPIRDALLGGYRDVPDRVDLYTAIGLMHLAPHHFRNREPNWEDRTLATLARASEIINRQHRPGRSLVARLRCE